MYCVANLQVDAAPYLETYRSGRNGADSKSVYRFLPVRGFESLRLRFHRHWFSNACYHSDAAFFPKESFQKASPAEKLIKGAHS